MQVLIRFRVLAQAFVPEVLDTKVYDEIITVDNEDAFETWQDNRQETKAYLVGISC